MTIRLSGGPRRRRALSCINLGSIDAISGRFEVDSTPLFNLKEVKPEERRCNNVWGLEDDSLCVLDEASVLLFFLLSAMVSGTSGEIAS
jgi:hypothetical protein